VTYPPYLREKARQLRREKDLTIDEIAERLAVGRTTVFYWVGDMPRPVRARSRRSPNQKLGNEAMQAKYRRLREEAYELGYWEFPRLCALDTFRDFVCMYIGEGYKRSRNTVSIGNSDSSVVRLAQRWILQFTRNKVAYSIQYHADQALLELCSFWAVELGVSVSEIRLQRKSNSKGLAARTWRSEHGVLTVGVGDTLLRARLQGWIDRLQEQWLDSPCSGRSSVW
jgi:hypothetical protein